MRLVKLSVTSKKMEKSPRVRIGALGVKEKSEHLVERIQLTSKLKLNKDSLTDCLLEPFEFNTIKSVNQLTR